MAAVISNPNKSIEICYQKRKLSIVMLILFVAILGVFGTLAITQWVKDAEEGKVSLKTLVLFSFILLFHYCLWDF